MKKIFLLVVSISGIAYADDTNNATQYQAEINAAATMAQDPNYQAQQQAFSNKAAQVAGAAVANTFVSVPYIPKSDYISEILQTQTNTKIVFSSKVKDKPIIYDVINQKAKLANTTVLTSSPYTIIIDRKSDLILININNSKIGITLNNKMGGFVVN